MGPRAHRHLLRECQHHRHNGCCCSARRSCSIGLEALAATTAIRPHQFSAAADVPGATPPISPCHPSHDIVTEAANQLLVVGPNQSNGFHTTSPRCLSLPLASSSKRKLVSSLCLHRQSSKSLKSFAPNHLLLQSPAWGERAPQAGHLQGYSSRCSGLQKGGCRGATYTRDPLLLGPPQAPG